MSWSDDKELSLGADVISWNSQKKNYYGSEFNWFVLSYSQKKKKKKKDLFYPFSSHISNRCVVDDEFHDCITNWQIASILSTLTPDDLKGICPVGEHL